MTRLAFARAPFGIGIERLGLVGIVGVGCPLAGVSLNPTVVGTRLDRAVDASNRTKLIEGR
jgi:hypothetical protein